MQLLAVCAVDSALGAMREHPFHLPRIFRDLVFILKTKANGLGGGPTILPPPLPSLLRFRAAKTRHDGALLNTSSS